EPLKPLLELLHGGVEAVFHPRDEALRRALARLLEELDDPAAVGGIEREADRERDRVVVDRPAVVSRCRAAHALRLEQDRADAHTEIPPAAPAPAPAGIAARSALYASFTRPICVPRSSASTSSRS